MKARQWVAIAFVAQCSVTDAMPAEIVAALEDQRQVAVTIYNSDLALVKDTREVALGEGHISLAWRDVSAGMRPETALVRDLSDPHGIAVSEQNFDFDLLTPQTLLQKYVGRDVRVLSTNPSTGVQTSEQATLLAANDGVVLRFADRIESSPNGRIAFEGVPQNLRDRPTLVIDLEAAHPGAHNLEISYLTSGLSWKADYVAELSDNDAFLDLDGWVTLTNQSGAAYRNARLQLVAGDVNRVRDALGAPRPLLARFDKPAAAAQKVAEESLLEYHLYTLERPTSVSSNQSKQVALLSAQHIPVTIEYLLRGTDSGLRSDGSDTRRTLKIGVLAHFSNREPGLGMPLPKGVIRVYKKDRSGNAQFVGEDQIDHTPKDEAVKIRLGDAFDVSATRRQTAYQKLAGGGREQSIYEWAYALEIHNAKSRAIDVHVQEPIPGDWEMLSESQTHLNENSNLAGWVVAVPAGGSTVLTYRIRTRM